MKDTAKNPSHRTVTIAAALYVFAVMVMMFAFAASTHFVHAGSVVWSRTIARTMFFACDPQHAVGWGWGSNCASVLANPNVSVTYRAQATNVATGANVCNASVPVGTTVKFQFVPHSYEDVYWFGTGFNMDSPYGDWSEAAAAPPSEEVNCKSPTSCTAAKPENHTYWCADKNFLNKWGTPQFPGDNRSYVLLQVDPPQKTVANIAGFNCGTPSADGSVTCVAQNVGSTNPEFQFADTYGKWYFAHWYDTYWQNQYPWLRSTQGCVSNTTPLSTINDLSTTQEGSWGGTAIPGMTALRSNASYQYKLNVPAQTIACPITVVPSSTKFPSPPAISTGGACVVGQTYTISLSSVDPVGRQLKYGIDWDTDGNVDQWVPANGYVNSGTSQNATRTYATPGVKRVQVLAQNDQGVTSEWSASTFSCADIQCPAGYLREDNQCIRQEQCLSRCVNSTLVSCTGETIQVCTYGCTNGACNGVPAPTATLTAAPSLIQSGATSLVTWNAVNVVANTCAVSGTNGDSWTGMTSGSKRSSSITARTVFTLHCNAFEGASPSFIEKQATVDIQPTFREL